MRTALLALFVLSLAEPAFAQEDSTYIRETALEECIAAHDAVMADPSNRSEITPDVHRWRASLAYARQVDARASGLVLIVHPAIAQTIPPPPADSVADTAPVANPPMLDQLKDLQQRYTALRAEKDKSAQMLLWAGGIAAALKFALDLAGKLAGGTKWLSLVALGIAVPIGLLSHFAGGHGWFDSVIVAGAGPGAVFVHELVKRFTKKPKAVPA